MSVDPAILQQLLQGGGPPSGLPTGQDPTAAGSPLGPDPSQAGPPPAVDQAAAGGSGGAGGQSTSEILQQMIDLAKSYLDTEQDQQDLHTMTKVLSQLQQYLAREQSEQDGMLQGKMSPKAMRSAYSGA